MKREILFRGKTESGRWAYGSLISAGTYCCILESEDMVHPTDYPYLDDDLGTIDGKATPVIPDTVGQFIGLTDRNGKQIFEGDIVDTEAGYTFFRASDMILVRWEDKSCGFEPFSDSIENCGHCGGGVQPDIAIVVGNIHDNPELLPGGGTES